MKLTSCREISFLLSEQSDRKLRWLEKIQVRAHLLMCRICRQYEKDLNTIRRILRHYRFHHDTWTDGLSAPARERIKKALHNGDRKY